MGQTDRGTRTGREQSLDEVRRLFERYRETARRAADAPAQPDRASVRGPQSAQSRRPPGRVLAGR